MTRRAYLALGSNEGDRAAHLQAAVDSLAAAEGVDVVAVSAVYETDPIGPDQPDYLNAVVEVETSLAALDLLRLGQALEAAAGRPPEHERERWGPRPLDVDVLVVGDEHHDTPELVVPHPRMRERHFVLAPLADVAPGLVEVPLGGWRGVRRTGVELKPHRP